MIGSIVPKHVNGRSVTIVSTSTNDFTENIIAFTSDEPALCSCNEGSEAGQGKEEKTLEIPTVPSSGH